MNKIFMLPIVIVMILSCNNNTENTSGNVDTSMHQSHHNATADTTTENGMNAIKQTMDKMMHEMHASKSTGNNDIDFATMMLTHHKGAVEMSKVEINQGSNAELKTFAQKVIDDQNKEIAFMEEFISKAPKSVSANATDFQKALSSSMMAMMNDTRADYNNIDKDFAAQMIPHHQSAVDMAQAYLKYGQEASLQTLCKNILDSQSKEIHWLKEWLIKNAN